MDFDTLINNPEKALLNIVTEVVQETCNKIADSFESALSNRPESSYYDRTGDLADAWRHPIIKYKNGEISYQLYDINRIRQKRTPARMFNAHMSLKGQTSYRGFDIRDIALFNQENGYWVPSPLYSDPSRVGWRYEPGLHYVEKAVGTDLNIYIQKIFDEKQKEAMNLIKNKLRRMGVL